MLLLLARLGSARRGTAHFRRYSSQLTTSQLVKCSEDEEVLDCAPFRCVRVPAAPGSTPTSRPVVLLPGMGHASWFYRGVQDVLAEKGVESFAIDLLTMHRFKTVASLAADLETAMLALPVERPVLAGHSQGGLLTQAYMARVDGGMPTEKQVSAVGLIGTGSLGHFANTTRSNLRVFQVAACGVGFRPYLNFILSMGEARRKDVGAFNTSMALFCLPSSTTTDLTGVELTMQQYYELMCSSSGGLHGDGWPTATHCYIEPMAQPLRVPSLSVSFEHDECYPPFHSEWHAEHYGSEILKVEGQPHCWVAPGWRETFAQPFARWVAEQQG